MIRVGLESGSEAAHDVLCRDEVDLELERWLAEDRELDGLADPLAGMASRRLSAAGVAASPDAADAIAAAVALLAYLLRQLRLWRAARSQRALLAAGHVRPHDDPEDGLL